MDLYTFKEFKGTLINSFEAAPVIPGYSHIGEYVIRDFVSNASDEVFDWLMEITTGDDKNLASEVVAILSRLNPIANKSWRINLIYYVCTNDNVGIRDNGYALAENWGMNKDDKDEVIRLLKNCKDDDVPWLEEYRKSIIEHLIEGM